MGFIVSLFYGSMVRIQRECGAAIYFSIQISLNKSFLCTLFGRINLLPFRDMCNIPQ